jgi:addiction module HigA family antidote
MLMHNPSHPGRILRQALEGRSLTAVAAHLGVSRITLTRIVNEKAGISPGMSLKLSDALGTSPNFWHAMQAQYDFWQASQAKRKKLPLLKDAA